MFTFDEFSVNDNGCQDEAIIPSKNVFDMKGAGDRDCFSSTTNATQWENGSSMVNVINTHISFPAGPPGDQLQLNAVDCQLSQKIP